MSFNNLPVDIFFCILPHFDSLLDIIALSQTSRNLRAFTHVFCSAEYLFSLSLPTLHLLRNGRKHLRRSPTGQLMEMFQRHYIPRFHASNKVLMATMLLRAGNSRECFRLARSVQEIRLADFIQIFGTAMESAAVWAERMGMTYWNPKTRAVGNKKGKKMEAWEGATKYRELVRLCGNKMVHKPCEGVFFRGSGGCAGLGSLVVLCCCFDNFWGYWILAADRRRREALENMGFGNRLMDG
jgi:hypothetical protein